jgi:cytochrome c
MDRRAKYGTIFRKLGVLAAIAAVAPPAPTLAEGDPARGLRMAEQWCTGCHLVSLEQAQATEAGPSFTSIAESAEGDLDWLAAFLVDPHPPMPDMSLTRQEIQDLTAYIRSLSKSEAR